MSQRAKNYQYTSRINGVTAIIFLIAGLIAARLFFIQVLEHKNYFALAEKQQGNSESPVKRGDIYFINKDGTSVTAATTESGYLLYINTKLLKNPDGVFNQLNSITEISRDDFIKIAAKPSDPYEILKHHLAAADGEKIKSLNLPGVGLEPENWRFYPNGELASHVLGFTSDASGSVEGKYGVEKFYETKLSSPKNNLLNEENNVELTIEPFVQEFAENKLKEVKEKWQAESAGMVIIEPQTGKIRAMAAIPNFNPNSYSKEKDFDVFLNPFVEKIFEMGSVFKPLTMSSAIDKGAVTPDTTYVDKGQITIDGRVIKNFDGKARGKQTMTQVLEESLNLGAIYAMQQLGGKNLRDYFHKFGLGEKLGIGLPGELKGNLTNLDSNREVEFATASFGQGVAVTPIELIMALSALANKGKLIQPIIIESASPQEIRQVIRPESAETVTRMLVTVVDTSLAGGKAKIDGYSIAAKTGTAEIPIKNGRGYSEDYLHTYFGYFPAYDPRFLIFMFLNRPQGVKYASQSLTDTFSDTVKFLINYYTIPPDR